MNLIQLLLLSIISLTHTVISQKMYFPGKTNEDEVNLRRLNKFSSAVFKSELNSNLIQEESDEDYFHKETPRSKIITNNKATTRIPFGSKINANTVSYIESYGKNIGDETQALSEESFENRAESSSQKFSKQRIPPPSIVSAYSTKSSLRVCEIKYAEYIQRIFPQESDTASDANDAEFNGRTLAAPGEYPHMAAIGFDSYDGQMDYKCGGSLISEKFVITAAHCTNFTGLQPSKVRIGDLNLMAEEKNLEIQIRKIKNIYVHPNYKTASYYNDIALLELERDVHLTEFVRPIRLWTKDTLPFTTAYALGYGSTSFAKERTNRLTNLNMTIVPNDECNREMPKFPQTEKGILLSQICARDYKLNRDTCQGDSGGPLQFNIRGQRRQNRLHYHLIGITSYGLFCRSSSPSIFTRVWYYLDWIEYIVWRDYFQYSEQNLRF